MTWNEVAADGIVVLRLSGEIDLQHSPKLRQLLRSKVEARLPALLLDFSDVCYIDSSGLATLIEYYQNSRAYQGRIALAGLNQRVRSIFDLVRLSEIFPIFADPSLAQASLCSPPSSPSSPVEHRP